MKCPSCPDSTLVMSDKQGVEIDYCPSCRGISLDRGELDKLLDKAGSQAAAAAPMTALLAEVRKAATKMDSTPTLADSVKTQFAAFRKDFDAVRAKLGVGAPAFAAGPGGVLGGRLAAELAAPDDDRGIE